MKNNKDYENKGAVKTDADENKSGSSLGATVKAIKFKFSKANGLLTTGQKECVDLIDSYGLAPAKRDGRVLSFKLGEVLACKELKSKLQLK